MVRTEAELEEIIAELNEEFFNNTIVGVRVVEGLFKNKKLIACFEQGEKIILVDRGYAQSASLEQLKTTLWLVGIQSCNKKNNN